MAFGSVIIKSSVIVHPSESVIVTVYVPGRRPLTLVEVKVFVLLGIDDVISHNTVGIPTASEYGLSIIRPSASPKHDTSKIVSSGSIGFGP